MKQIIWSSDALLDETAREYYQNFKREELDDDAVTLAVMLVADLVMFLVRVCGETSFSVTVTVTLYVPVSVRVNL